MTGLKRRAFVSAVASSSLLAAAGHRVGASPLNDKPIPGIAAPAVDSVALARDEGYWGEVAQHFTRAGPLVNLEHGYWGKMAAPVQDAYLQATRQINDESSIYGRKHYGKDAEASVERIARSLGVSAHEIVLTRNATEAIHNLIRQYTGLAPGDRVLYADIDYPQFKTTMAWLEQSRGVSVTRLDLPGRASGQQIVDRYVEAFDRHTDLKLMLLTHASNQHGLVLPVRRIAAEARRRGIDVICDCAQSWGLVDFQIEDLGVDWAGFNLHKWIGNPLGVGALYLRRGSYRKIAPYPGEEDADHSRAAARVHTGTANFAAMASVPWALDFHEALGGANKEARLRYLRSLWTDAADTLEHIEVLGGATEDDWSGMGAFRLAGQSSVDDARALQARLENDFGIFTVMRGGLSGGACVRVTPQVFNTPEDMARLSDALMQLRS
ncbi:MAG: aminotransferase class V-fold PLP-dependent enzyme [Pseudomonadota bacterium]